MSFRFLWSCHCGSSKDYWWRGHALLCDCIFCHWLRQTEGRKVREERVNWHHQMSCFLLFHWLHKQKSFFLWIKRPRIRILLLLLYLRYSSFYCSGLKLTFLGRKFMVIVEGCLSKEGSCMCRALRFQGYCMRSRWDHLRVWNLSWSFLFQRQSWCVHLWVMLEFYRRSKKMRPYSSKNLYLSSLPQLLLLIVLKLW